MAPARLPRTHCAHIASAAARERTQRGQIELGVVSQNDDVSRLADLQAGQDFVGPTDDQIVRWTLGLLRRDVVVTYDVPRQADGLIPQPFLNQLRRIGAAVQAAPPR